MNHHHCKNKMEAITMQYGKGSQRFLQKLNYTNFVKNLAPCHVHVRDIAVQNSFTYPCFKKSVRPV